MMQERQRRRETQRNLLFGCLTLVIVMFVIYSIRFSQSIWTVHGAPVKKKTRLRGSSFIAPDAEPFVSDKNRSNNRKSLLLTHSLFLSMH
jgi:hypothetical protein